MIEVIYLLVFVIFVFSVYRSAYYKSSYDSEISNQYKNKILNDLHKDEIKELTEKYKGIITNFINSQRENLEDNETFIIRKPEDLN